MPLRRSALAAILAIPLVLTACSGDDQGAISTSTSSSTPANVTMATTSSTTSSMTTEVPEPVTEQQADVEPEPEPAEPYVVECLPDPPGPATWSDGTVRFSQDCYDQGVANRGAHRCPGTDSYVDDPSQCYTPPSVDELYPHGPNLPGGAPAPGTMQEEVAEGCRSGQLVGPDCAQFM